MICRESPAQVLTLHLGGAAIDEEIICEGFRFDVAVNITKMTLFAREAPVGAAFSVDFLKNGAEQAKTVSIADGQQQGNGSVTGLSYSTLEDFGLKVKSVGSSVPGSEITLVIHYQVQPVP